MSDAKTVDKSNKLSRADRLATNELSVRKMRRTLMWLAICFWLLVLVAVPTIALVSMASFTTCSPPACAPKENLGLAIAGLIALTFYIVRAVAVLILGIRLKRATEALGVTKKGTFAVVSAGSQLFLPLGFIVWAILLNSRIIH